LIDAHQSRIENSETAIAAEEIKETRDFLAKIKPLKLANFRIEGKIPRDYAEY